MKKNKAFSLLELLLVVILVSIIATFILPNYWGVHRRTLEKEAKALLKLIQAAERTRQFELGNFTACSDTANCNTVLNLNLPTGGYWTYSVSVRGDSFCAQATDKNKSSVFHITNDLEEAISGVCQ
ncbi:MAG: prepilin-type N-terminal cleavage/methylation domain-containing protein [Candidatus Omnitrophica bacterium]|nr:prepilin-type N-terminal cleavage/methylation domain-containing protein [Candidatus Omnitrophota bacterium]